jgi:4-hydroxy-tetrahydrodipicolinate reductase
MTPPLRVAVAGASGRMGRMLIDAVEAASDCKLAGTLDIGRDIASGLADAQVLIDFTRPEGTLAHLAACRERGVKMVVGTTGFSEADKSLIAEHSKHIALMLSPNMSVGVNLVLRLLDTAARALADGYDIEIVEAHHRHKVDAPSGTALKLGEVISRALQREGPDVFVHGRHGDTGERPVKQIGFHAIRGGDIVGEHTVIFAGAGERVEVTVRSQSRMTYAAGALRAAKWLQGRPAGLYDMSDVLGMR